MPHLKLTTACALALLLVATGASAGKTRTKSNQSNERGAPQGVVLQDSAVGANACFAGTGNWSWAAVSSVGTLAGGAGGGAAAASYAATGRAVADIGAVCDSVQSVIDRINADATKLGAMDAAVEAQDEAAIRALLIESGLSPQQADGAQFHAINTKGTGATNGRVSASNNGVSDEPPQIEVADRKAVEMTNRLSMNVTVARMAGGLSFTISRSYKNKNGHVTLNR